ncbi:hypothetical protein DUNSADRAFT_5856 [Dunaliella salina]|uniref:AMP-dependent synthetase/ligase domain-containing protein n=1 Tax=Dunaliella salina TaxID=3046 RepID=A0ABQ7FU32_DUNSA|nr:hypothetical protein DUNSADRAFT_5856 [Dunaliella salina]|eukprot:KAF5825930.1 hypothetical protein DUNSADRAFT_5856 [Dunaliella salina]
MGGFRKQACSAGPVHLCLPLLNISDSNTERRDAEESSDGTGSSIQPGAPHTIDLASMASRVAALSHGLSLAISPHSALPGQTVMLAAMNSSAMLEVLLAICDTGAIVTPINHRWGPAELAAAMQLTQPVAIIMDAACRALVQQALAWLSQRIQTVLQPRLILMGSGTGAGNVHVPLAGAGQPPWDCSSHRGNSSSCPSEVELSTEGQIPGNGCSSIGETSGSQRQSCDPNEAHLSTEGLIRAGRCVLASSNRGSGEAEADLQQTDVCGGGTVAACGEGQHMPYPLQLKAPADGAAIICFTSGTTGRPKGVVLTHAALHAQSLAKLATINYTATDTYLHLAPLFHVGGLSSAHAALMAGCGQVHYIILH